uniref:FYVE-type domain-containing protein n=1 Tax=Hyaloperonospora arabidopsidis (strain Emoy2) TaxID=559515 RepID=M4BFY6_HYAAE
MPKDTYRANPYADVHLSDLQRHQLIDVVNGCVQSHFEKYEHFVMADKHQMDERRWERVKFKDGLNVYAERSIHDQARKGLQLKAAVPEGEAEKELVAMMCVGTLVGDLEDLMFGILSTTWDALRIKAAYIGSVVSGAILCNVVEPSVKEPFRSVIVRWMASNGVTKAGQSRDFVVIEATDVVELHNGERIGYHVFHSVDFPQTRPLPNTVRGNMSSVSLFRHVHSTIIDSFASCVVDPGVVIKRLQFIPFAATAMLCATSYVHCGQMKKLAWMLQRRHVDMKHRDESHQKKKCVMCGKNKNIPGLNRSTCKLCYGYVCSSCKVRVQMKFIGQDSELVERKISFCSQCMSKAINCGTREAAQEQAVYYHDSYDSGSTYSESILSDSSSSLSH